MNGKLICALLALSAAGAVQAQKMPWAKDFASAQKAAASAKKLVMLDFYTDW